MYKISMGSMMSLLKNEGTLFRGEIKSQKSLRAFHIHVKGFVMTVRKEELYLLSVEVDPCRSSYNFSNGHIEYKMKDIAILKGLDIVSLIIELVTENYSSTKFLNTGTLL